MTAPNATLPPTKPQARSRVSNGSALLNGVDGRSVWARRLRDVIELHVADLGGVENVSAAERSIVRRAATLTVELEALEARFANAGEATADDLDLYQRTAGNLRRLLEAVGLERRARDVTPRLADYLKSKSAEGGRAMEGGALVSVIDVPPAASGLTSGLAKPFAGPSK